MNLTIEQVISTYKLEKSPASPELKDVYRASAVLSSAYELAKILPESYNDVEGWND